MEQPSPQPDLEAIRRFGVEPDLDRYDYDVNACAACGQPVLIVTSKETGRNLRTEITACPYCMQRLSRRTRAKEFRWIFLEGWSPD